MKYRAILCALLALNMNQRSAAMKKLECFNIDRSEISVSGISSGGAFAAQLHVAFSSMFKGLGSIAGVPYHCAKDDILTAIGACMSSPSDINVAELVEYTKEKSDGGEIDPISNLKTSRVYIFSGSLDSVVDPGVSEKMESYYKEFLEGSSQIKTVFNMEAEHTFPTLNYGNPCTDHASPYIGNCSYSAALDLLKHIYVDIQEPSGSATLDGEFIEFEQSEFNTGGDSGAGSDSIDTVGYAYIPSGCASKETGCKLHIAFHGCNQGRHFINDEFAKNTGYNEIAELNNIKVIYPQAKPDPEGGNPYGCWDWWGYTGSNYDLKSGVQMQFVKNIVDNYSQ